MDRRGSVHWKGRPTKAGVLVSVNRVVQWKPNEKQTTRIPQVELGDTLYHTAIIIYPQEFPPPIENMIWSFYRDCYRCRRRCNEPARLRATDRALGFLMLRSNRPTIAFLRKSFLVKRPIVFRETADWLTCISLDFSMYFRQPDAATTAVGNGTKRYRRWLWTFIFTVLSSCAGERAVGAADQGSVNMGALRLSRG